MTDSGDEAYVMMENRLRAALIERERPFAVAWQFAGYRAHARMLPDETTFTKAKGYLQEKQLDDDSDMWAVAYRNDKDQVVASGHPALRPLAMSTFEKHERLVATR